MIPALTKRTTWSRLYDFDFSSMAEMQAGETISTASVPSVSGVTVGSTVISGSRVQVRISGGTANASYTLTCTITTSGGSTLDLTGILYVVA